MKKRNYNLFIYLFFNVIFILMFIYACFLCVKTIYNPTYESKYIFGTIVAAYIILYSLIASKVANRLSIKLEIVYVVFIMLLAFILRWIGIVIMRTTQISDFSFPHDAIRYFKGDLSDSGFFDYIGNYYAKFPAWFPFMRLLNIFYDLFCGGEVNIEAVKYGNAVLNTITCGGIYYASRCLFSRKVGIIASILYCCFPSLIIWTNITTPDHITMFLFVLQMIVWYWMWKKTDNWKIHIILICVHSIICILINWFKPLVILYLLVLVFYLIGTYDKSDRKKIIFGGIIYFFSFLLCFIGSSKILSVWVENSIQRETIDSTWLYIYCGSVMKEDGTMDNAKANEVMAEVFQQNESIDDQMRIFKEMAIEQIIENKMKLPVLWLDKYREAMNCEGATWYWCNTNTENGYGDKLNEVLGLEYYFISNQYYLLLLILVVLCGISQLISKYKNVNIFYLFLTVSGFIGILVVSGVQSRYKLIIMPYLVIMGAYGLDSISCIISGSNIKAKQLLFFLRHKIRKSDNVT